MLTGDLLSQCIGGSFAARELAIPHLGIYSACASFGEGLILAAMALEGGFASHAVVAVSSHHDSAERQFRFPTELGVQRPPTAQWTATLAAAVLLGYPTSPYARPGPRVRLTGATIGEVIDIGIKDPYDMGTAMAPAACDTLATHFKDFGISPSHYDTIITGDLGAVGRVEIAVDLLESKGLAVRNRFEDWAPVALRPAPARRASGGQRDRMLCGRLLRLPLSDDARRAMAADPAGPHGLAAQSHQP